MVKNVNGQNIEWDYRSTGKTLNGKNIKCAKRRIVNNNERA